MRRRATTAALAVLALSILVLPWPWAGGSPQQREVRILAKQYAYAPGVIEVSRGDRVTLVLDAEDMTHGLYVDGYGVEAVAAPGRPASVSFVADRPGRFRLRCSKVCGPLHPFMLGDLVVTPHTAFWRAAALAVVTALGTVLWLTGAPRRTEA
jgi:heme/copper-type cytochrome/quinol oxidase subunit 2